jgi:hypothetical protein
MAYGQCEPGFGFRQLSGQPKQGAGGTGTNYGDTLAYVRANDRWEKAVAGSIKPFGFNGNTKLLTQTLDVLTGVTTTTRGSADADTTLSVVVAGRIEKIAGAAIPPGELVMVDSTAPVTKVMAWNGTDADAVVGRYIRNITQHHNYDTLPAAALDDAIIIDIEPAMTAGPHV